MKRFAAVAIALPLMLAQTAPVPSRTITAVRHWALPEATRIAIEVSGEFSYRTDRLHEPERVYFDILDSRPSINGRRVYSEAVADQLVQRIRIAETTPGTSRVVLDLGANVDVASSQLTNPARLIVELRRPSSEQTEARPLEPAPRAAAQTTQSRAPELPQAAVSSPAAAPTPAITAEPSKAQLAKTEQAKTATVREPAKTTVREPAKTTVREPAKKAAAPTPPPEVPRQATRTSAGSSSLIRALGLKVGKVVIDPGHGGHDQGTQGPRGLLEKDLVLDVAKRLGRMVEERMGAEVIYTRSDDTYVPLEARTAMANENRADLFLSIHANSSSGPKIAGVETFYLNFTGTRDAMDVAARENASSQMSVHELSDLIQKIARQDKSEESREFAHQIQRSLYSFSARNVSGSKDRGVKSAPFVVLIGANMPSVLTEIGFLSNTREETLLKRTDYRQRLADAIYRGLERYAGSLSHFQVARKPAASAAAQSTSPAASASSAP